MGADLAVDNSDMRVPTKYYREVIQTRAHRSMVSRLLRGSNDEEADLAEAVAVADRLGGAAAEAEVAEVAAGHNMAAHAEDNQLGVDMAVQKSHVRWLHLKDQDTDRVWTSRRAVHSQMALLVDARPMKDLRTRHFAEGAGR